jgi:CheY-like chemotaxis protein
MNPPQPSAATVLIVEDDRDVASSISDVISALGYRSVTARDGREAVSALDDEQPSVILVDMFMPEMSGSEFLGMVRKSPKWSLIPRVIITGTNDSMIGVREDSPVLFKPVDFRTLAQVVRTYCEQGSQKPTPSLAAAR